MATKTCTCGGSTPRRDDEYLGVDRTDPRWHSRGCRLASTDDTPRFADGHVLTVGERGWSMPLRGQYMGRTKAHLIEIVPNREILFSTCVDSISAGLFDVPLLREPPDDLEIVCARCWNSYCCRLEYEERKRGAA